MSAAPALATELFKSPDIVYDEAYEGRQFDAVYFAMLIFACLIALMGLLLNSPAVIIGAMLISPLMGPILACGLSLTTAEWALGKKAGRNLLLSVAEVVLIAVIATHLSPLREATPEILARTNPNLMDLLIAFFSGLAGTVALASRKTAFTILPGVAIATAVMPPLATVGYGIGTQQWAIARGAFMLFFTNFTAIVLSASLVFLLIGFRPSMGHLGHSHRLLVRWRIAIAATILVVISIPLMRTLTHAAEQANIRGQVQDTLKRSLQAHSDRQLDSVSVELLKGAVAVGASIQTAQYMEPAEIQQLQSALAGRVGMPVRLQVQQLQLARKTASTEQVIRDFLAAGLVRPAPVEKALSPAAEIGNLQQRLETSLRSLVAAAGVTPQIISVGKATDGSVVINVLAQAPQLTSADMWKVAAAALANEVSARAKMNVSVAGTGAALHIPYHATNRWPSRAELRRVRQFAASLPKGVSVAFISSADIDQALTTRRIAQLRRVVSRDTADMKLEPPTAANVITIVPVQTITAESLQIGDSSPQQPAPGASHL
jgi:uncharacterized hydrophobic protein (TIGR00271 family)